MADIRHYGVLGMKWGVRKDGMSQGWQGSKNGNGKKCGGIYKSYDESEALVHYGVLGMKWGVRKDGKPQGFQYGTQVSRVAGPFGKSEKMSVSKTAASSLSKAAYSGISDAYWKKGSDAIEAINSATDGYKDSKEFTESYENFKNSVYKGEKFDAAVSAIVNREPMDTIEKKTMSYLQNAEHAAEKMELAEDNYKDRRRPEIRQAMESDIKRAYPNVDVKNKKVQQMIDHDIEAFDAGFGGYYDVLNAKEREDVYTFYFAKTDSDSLKYLKKEVARQGKSNPEAFDHLEQIIDTR